MSTNEKWLRRGILTLFVVIWGDFCKWKGMVKNHAVRAVEWGTNLMWWLSLMVLPCLQRGTAIKIDGCQSKDAKHPWYSMAPGNKFDLASVICKSVRQMYIICQITNVDAMIGQVVCSVVYDLGELHRAVRCDLLMPWNFGQLRRKCMLVSSC